MAGTDKHIQYNWNIRYQQTKSIAFLHKKNEIRSILLTTNIKIYLGNHLIKDVNDFCKKKAKTDCIN